MIERTFTKEEVIKALECCQVTLDIGCESCPYYNSTDNTKDCVSRLCADALNIIEKRIGVNE